MNNYHIVPILNGWALKQSRTDTTITTAETKETIVSKATQLLQDQIGSLKIHRADGTIEEERTYPRSADPHATVG
jgi:hypothetical protein